MTLEFTRNLGPLTTLAADGIPQLELTAVQRFEKRQVAILPDGCPAVLDVTHTRTVMLGDVLSAEDGTWVRVGPAPEEVIEARAASWLTVCRMLHQIGRRRALVELGDLTLSFKPDHDVERLASDLGMTLTKSVRNFDPEPWVFGREPA
ncbi:MAG: hypothetical protein LBU12_04250 [Deltaproteobacteria bacterium]|jgi:urease accessory protein UreE|nr:hypothetical protein [Deltaproteobacteria bacterium]